jgi:Ca-activated chloride channel family protein
MLLMGSSAIHAAEPSQAIVVFDASGSMWGKLDGERQSKFTNAREAIKATLGKAKFEMKLGLVAFGHRRGDCNDVQVILPPDGNASTERFAPPLERLNPKGKGPLTNALKEAAKVLGAGSGNKSLILVHDDPDNCSADPCAALADIQAAAPGVVVHVVGLGLQDEEAQRLQCLTKPTKGKFVDARNAQEVATGIEDIFTLANLDLVPPPPSPAVRPAQPASAITTSKAQAPLAKGERAPLATDGPSGVRLATTLIAGQLPIFAPAHWYITAEGETANAFTPVSVTAMPDQIFALPSGRYTIEARTGFVTQKQVVSVAPKGTSSLDLVLNAAQLRLPAAPPSGWPADSFLSIVSTDGKVAGIRSLAELGPTVAVPPGPWLVRIDQGSARAEASVTVAAGVTVDIASKLTTGNLQITVAGFDSVSRAQTVVQVMEDDPEAPRGLREIARSAATTTDLVLPAGTYAVIARQGPVEVRERLAIAAGETVKRTLTLAGARLSLGSRLAGAAASTAADEVISYRIERIDVVPNQTFTANRQSPKLELPAGRYRIEARHGLINARSSRVIELSAGQQAAVILEQQAGMIRLVAPQGHQGDMLWEIFDAEGRALWGTAQPAPRATLQAGRYTVRAESRDKRYERSFDIRAGQSTTVELTD